MRALLVKLGGWLARSTLNPVQQELLSLLVQARGLPAPDTVRPGSREGRHALALCFKVLGLAEHQINELCQRYYDHRHPKHYLWREHNRFLYERIRPGDRVIDVGCSNAFYPQWIAEKAATVVCIDVNPERVEQARGQNRSDKVHYEVMDVTENLPEGRFDVAICSHVLEHLDDPASVLEALSPRIPRLLVKVPLVDSHWMKLVKKDIGLFWMDDRDHRREYTEDLLRSQLETAGWSVVELIRGFDLRASAESRHLPQDPQEAHR